MRELYTIILQIFHNLLSHLPDALSMLYMDLKIFLNTIVLLKVDCFERFSNQSNVDKLVIKEFLGMQHTPKKKCHNPEQQSKATNFYKGWGKSGMGTGTGTQGVKVE